MYWASLWCSIVHLAKSARHSGDCGETNCSGDNGSTTAAVGGECRWWPDYDCVTSPHLSISPSLHLHPGTKPEILAAPAPSPGPGAVDAGCRGGCERRSVGLEWSDSSHEPQPAPIAAAHFPDTETEVSWLSCAFAQMHNTLFFGNPSLRGAGEHIIILKWRMGDKVSKSQM